MITANVLDPKIEALIATVMALPPTNHGHDAEGRLVVTPSMNRQEALHWLTRTAHGAAFARHHAAITKKEEEPPMTRTQEMQEMRKFVTSTPGGMTSIAKGVISDESGTALTEHEYITLWEAEAGKAAFAKEFEAARSAAALIPSGVGRNGRIFASLKTGQFSFLILEKRLDLSPDAAA